MTTEENTKTLPEITSQQQEFAEKSEEVQAIIDRMPTYWVKWVALCVSVLMGIIVLLGFLIQYPDTVDGQISVTATAAPVRLVANTNGRIILLQENKAQLGKGAVIGYIESGANYRHILLLDSLLAKLGKQSEVARNQLEMQRILLEETETKEKAFSDYIGRKNELENSISLWKERYLLYSPIAGELEFLSFWRDNSFVQAGHQNL